MADVLIPRRALATASESLLGFRAVVIQGARQTGKSTLANLRDDPAEFLARLGSRVLNFLTTRAVSESLAGRIDLVTLWPLSMGELTGGSDGFVDRAFDAPADLVHHRGAKPSRRDYLELVCRGGYPEANRLNDQSRRRWFERYLDAVLRREVESVADLRRFDALLGMARLLMATTGSELVVSRLAPYR